MCVCGLVTKMMTITGPRKLQWKPCWRSSQQLGKKGGVCQERDTAWCSPHPLGLHSPISSQAPVPRLPPAYHGSTTPHSLEFRAVALAVEGSR